MSPSPKLRPRSATATSLFALVVACAPTDGSPGPLGNTGGALATSGGAPSSTSGASTSGLGSGGAPSSSSGGAPVVAAGTPGDSTGGVLSTQGGATSGGAAAGGNTSGGQSASAGANTSGHSGEAGATAGASASGGAAGGARGGNGGAESGGSAQPAGGAGGGAGKSQSAGSAGLGGDSRCTSGTFIVCEGFESTAVGAIPTGWTRDGNAQLVQVASDQAARGAHALKLGAATSGARRLIRSAADFGAAHWGRLFHRVQTPPPVPAGGGVIHSTIAALQGIGPTIGPAEYRVVDTVENSSTMPAGVHQYLYNVQPSGSEFGKGSAYDYRYDGNWHCVEWQVDATTQSYRLYVNGAEVTQIAISNGAGNHGSGPNRSELPMSFSQLKIGWNNYQSASPGFVAWIDEVAIANTRIGCGN